MNPPRKLIEDLPQFEEDLKNPAERKRHLTEDLPQEEDEEPQQKVLTEDI